MTVPTRPKIAFLDRDGTINIDYGYVTSPEQVELIPGAAQAVARLKQAGYIVVIVSNQSAIGRGLATEADVVATNAKLEALLCADDPAAVIDLTLYSPATPEQGSDCRKPGIGLLDRVKSRWDFDASQSWVIGDKYTDLLFGQNAGLSPKHCILVLTGHGQEELAALDPEVKASVKIASDINSAANMILGYG